MNNKVLCFILLCIMFTIACHSEEKNMTYMVHLFGKDIFLKGPLVDDFSTSDTILVYPDSVYILKKKNKEKIILVKAGKGSNISGIMYLFCLGDTTYIIQKAFDPLSIFDVNIMFYDLDKKPPKEIVSIWTHEGDIYFIRIDRIEDDKITNIFISKDLGIPWINNGQPMTIKNDSLLVSYMLNDGSAHEIAVVTIDRNGRTVLKVVKRISTEDQK